jgi:hypothetical protein
VRIVFDLEQTAVFIYFASVESVMVLKSFQLSSDDSLMRCIGCKSSRKPIAVWLDPQGATELILSLLPRVDWRHRRRPRRTDLLELP